MKLYKSLTKRYNLASLQQPVQALNQKSEEEQEI